MRRSKSCGKELHRGDMAYNRWGVLLCASCDKANPPPRYSAYEGGELKVGGYHCGDKI